MTFSTVWSLLRWPLAILGLLAVVNYALPRLSEAASEMIEFDASGSILAPDDGGSESEEGLDVPVADLEPQQLQAPTGPVTDGVATPIADFYVNDTIADVDSPTLVVSDDEADAAILVFEIPPGDPSCIAVMNLTLTATEVLSPVEIGVFASTVEDAANVADNQAVDGELRLPTPMAVGLYSSPGTIAFNITGGYQDYFTQGFPPDKPLVLTVVPTVPVDPQGGLTFVASEAQSDQSPQLLYTGTPDCGAAAAEGATAAATPAAEPTQ